MRKAFLASYIWDSHELRLVLVLICLSENTGNKAQCLKHLFKSSHSLNKNRLFLSEQFSKLCRELQENATY